MSNLIGQSGELRLTVEVKRKETGKVEKFELIGYVSDDQLKEITNGSNSQHGGEERGD